MCLQDLIRRFGGIQKLVSLLASGAETECTHRALLALRILTDKEGDRLAILRAGGVSLLVGLLSSGGAATWGAPGLCTLVPPPGVPAPAQVKLQGCAPLMWATHAGLALRLPHQHGAEAAGAHSVQLILMALPTAVLGIGGPPFICVILS